MPFEIVDITSTSQENNDNIRCQSTDLPLSSCASSSMASDVLSLREQPKLSQQTLRNLLRFYEKPSHQLCRFYRYLIDQHAEEQLEFLLALRNHRILYHRFRQQRNNSTGINADERSLKCKDDKAAIDYREEPHQQQQISPSYLRHPAVTLIDDLSDLCNSIDDQVAVARETLNQSAHFIYHTYLAPESLKELNIARKLSNDVRDSLSENTFSPRIFNVVGEQVLQSLQYDAYQRFRSIATSYSIHGDSNDKDKDGDNDYESISAVTSILMERHNATDRMSFTAINSDENGNIGSDFDQLTLGSEEHLTIIDRPWDGNKNLPQIPTSCIVGLDSGQDGTLPEVMLLTKNRRQSNPNL